MAKRKPKNSKPKVEESEQKAPRNGTIITAERKAAYGKDANNGDEIAVALKGAVVDLDTLVATAVENGIEAGRWAHLNFGMQRMNLGNVLRGNMSKHQLGKPGFELPVIAGVTFGTPTEPIGVTS
jgi:hypothetical protein